MLNYKLVKFTGTCLNALYQQNIKSGIRTPYGLTYGGRGAAVVWAQKILLITIITCQFLPLSPLSGLIWELIDTLTYI